MFNQRWWYEYRMIQNRHTLAPAQFHFVAHHIATIQILQRPFGIHPTHVRNETAISSARFLLLWPRPHNFDAGQRSIPTEQLHQLLLGYFRIQIAQINVRGVRIAVVHRPEIVIARRQHIRLGCLQYRFRYRFVLVPFLTFFLDPLRNEKNETGIGVEDDFRVDLLSQFLFEQFQIAFLLFLRLLLRRWTRSFAVRG